MEEQEDSEIDALNNETFGDITDWDLEDHDLMAAGDPLRDQDLDEFTFRNGHPRAGQNINEHANELSERVASSIFDDEDEGARKPKQSWDNEKGRFEQRSNVIVFDDRPNPRPPLKVLTVQELEQNLRKDLNNGPGRNQPMIQHQSLEQYYRQGAIPKNLPPGMLFVDTSNTAQNQVPPNQSSFVRPPNTRPYFDRYASPHPRHQGPGGPHPRPGTHPGQGGPHPGPGGPHPGPGGPHHGPGGPHPGPGGPHTGPGGPHPGQGGPHPAQGGPRPRHPPNHAVFPGSHRFPPHPPQGYPMPFPQGPAPFMQHGGLGPRDQNNFMRGRNSGQYMRQPGPRPVYPGNMGRGRASNYNFPHPPQHMYMNYQNPGVPMGAHPHHMDDRRTRLQGYEDEYSGPLTDEYANLMTPQEKTFLKNIQLNALGIQNPYTDDFYYTMMNERRNNKEGKSNQYRDVHSKNQNMTRNFNSSKTSLYTPQQFENSLGKLQIGSVNAPRKIIDTQPMDYDTRGQPDEYSRGDRRRLNQQLNEVEIIAGVSLNVFYRRQLEVSDEDIRNAVNIIREHLCTKINYLMNLKKGRKLIKRLLEEDREGRFADAFLYAYPSLNHRDEDQEHVPFLSVYLETASSETIVKLSRRYSGIIIWDKPMMVTILFLMMERMFVIWDSQEIPEDGLTEWTRFLARQADSAPSDTTLIARPLVAVNKPQVLRFLTFLFRHDNVSVVDKFLNILT